ncbi:MAG TPA: tetratricopeptide repeat protein, partial [Thermoguttaceae bacterium]|nr:tetratricopeptide repeat protein [Thermoguttaceae bacterium]
LATNQIDRARRSAEQAIDLNPKLSDAWTIRGRVMSAGGQFERAMADYHRALGYAPNAPEILLETAELYRRMGQPQRALETLQSLADTYPPGEEPCNVLHLTGLAYEALGRHENGADAFYRLGQAEYLAGRMAEANAAAQHALSLQPDHLPSRDLLGRLELANRPDPAAQGASLYR